MDNQNLPTASEQSNADASIIVAEETTLPPTASAPTERVERVKRKGGKTVERSTRAASKFVRDINDVADTSTRREIAALRGQLKSASRNEQKKIRRKLRALGYFGGTREQDSRYYDASKDKLNLQALIERERRVSGLRADKTVPSTDAE